MTKNLHYTKFAEELSGTIELIGVFHDLAGLPFLKIHGFLSHATQEIVGLDAAFDKQPFGKGIIENYTSSKPSANNGPFEYSIALSVPLLGINFNETVSRLILFTELDNGDCLTSLIVVNHLCKLPIVKCDQINSTLSSSIKAFGKDQNVEQSSSLAQQILQEGYPESAIYYQLAEHLKLRRQLNISQRSLSILTNQVRLRKLASYLPEALSEHKPRSICLATTDIVGPWTNGGIGTFYTLLAETLKGSGHQVTILYDQGTYCERGIIEDWIQHYSSIGINFVPLPNDTALVKGENLMRRSYRVYQWLRNNSFDAVHFHEMLGSAYYSVLAKKQGIAFKDTTLFVECHSPFKWHRQYNYYNTPWVYQLEADIRERFSIEFADVAIFPSAYLAGWVQEQGWKLPKNSFVLPYPFLAQLNQEQSTLEKRSQRELVFFGRLEFRKGLDLFCDAVDLMLRSQEGFQFEQITFLGKEVQQNDFNSSDYLGARTIHWPVQTTLLPSFSRDQAIGYLQSGNTLAVIPSRSDNSPFVIYECLAFEIPFVASNVGGIPELLSLEEQNRVLFSLDREDLAAKIANSILGGLKPVTPGFSFEEVRNRWNNLHNDLDLNTYCSPPTSQVSEQFASEHRKKADQANQFSLCISRLKSTEIQNLLASLSEKDWEHCDLINSVKGSAKPDYIESNTLSNLQFRPPLRTLFHPAYDASLAILRNFAAGHSRSKFLLFIDDNISLTSNWCNLLAEIVERCPADIYTSFGQTTIVDPSSPDGIRKISTCLALGGALIPSILRNYQGEGWVLINRESFLECGGFDENGNGAFWPLISRMLLQHYTHHVIPQELFDIRFCTEQLEDRDPYLEQLETHQVYVDQLPTWAKNLPNATSSLYHRLHDDEKRHRQLGDLPSPSNSFRWLPERFESSSETLLTSDSSHGFSAITPLKGIRVDFQEEALEFFCTSGNPEFLLDKFEFPDVESIGIRFTISAPQDTVTKVLYTKKEPSSSNEQSCESGFPLRKGLNHIYFEINTENICGFLRLIPGHHVGRYTIYSLKLKSLERFSCV